ncbi:transcription factor gte6, partial [Chrysochromulina tobinii]
MLSSIARHKWAYPFKRPVTEKEAPDYREIIETPMDFATLKRRVETGQVADLHALCDDLNLIFENAMKYNGEGTDYYKMASTLRSIVANQKAQYLKLRGDSIEVKGVAGGAG